MKISYLCIYDVDRDVLRERERQARARAHLTKDKHDRTSSRPIFGEPIKVVPPLEDETSRRIKRTLGDFNQVQPYLTKDPTHLIGISKTATNTNNIVWSHNGKGAESDLFQRCPVTTSISINSLSSLAVKNQHANNEKHLESSLLLKKEKTSSRHHGSQKSIQQDPSGTRHRHRVEADGKKCYDSCKTSSKDSKHRTSQDESARGKDGTMKTVSSSKSRDLTSTNRLPSHVHHHNNKKSVQEEKQKHSKLNNQQGHQKVSTNS
ncbi:uncharacterized protein LOC106474538 isoform X2 [Limulus polyphemus]|uniref:Uncharacterized protein LOC106474538 isoform X2 n=1 Tax=Limulus polyphemus TaxID=6850 RepID=A0ABM1TRR6_LIMPO|nr:uncharacterized protein LOC106474538 isoform X2 [Limulus polyphemus]